MDRLSTERVEAELVGRKIRFLKQVYRSLVSESFYVFKIGLRIIARGTGLLDTKDDDQEVQEEYPIFWQ